MDHQERENRLRSDFETLTSLRECSSIFHFDGKGDPPDRYSLLFRGRGIARQVSPHAEMEFIDLHEIDMRLPFAYPELAPDIRWITPLLHPNVSFSGFINLRDVGLPWDETVTLDAVCERLWDVARMAYMNLDRATNFSAKNWIEQPDRIKFPVDDRILRDKMPPSGINVIRYTRRGAQRPPIPETGPDVMFIGEDTPVPPLPGRVYRPQRQARGDDDDILYIEDE